MEILQCDLCKSINNVSKETLLVGESKDCYGDVTADKEYIDLCLSCKSQVLEAALRESTEKIRFGYGLAILAALNRRNKDAR